MIYMVAGYLIIWVASFVFILSMVQRQRASAARDRGACRKWRARTKSRRSGRRRATRPARR